MRIIEEMERNREARRGSIPATANGLSRRRQRSSSLRDSPEEDGGALELQEMARLRDRASKKERDRDRDRLNRSKRRRGERLLHGNNREDGGEDSSEESLEEEEEDDDEDAVPSSTSAVRLPSMNPMPPALVSSSATNHHHHHHHHQRKSLPTKVVRAAGPPWKVSDEMIGVSVPRKARSGSVKRSHECSNTGGNGASGGAEQIFRQASTSPARPTTVTATPPAPVSPSSSNASARKKLKPIGAKNKPPKISKATSSSSIQEIEIEVAEVLFGMTRQFQCSSKQEAATSASNKTEAKDAGGSSNDAKSRVSSPVSASSPPGPHPYLLPQNSSSTALPSSAFAPRRKKPRPVKFDEDSPAGFPNPNASSTFSAAKSEDERLIESVENSSPKIEKDASSAVETVGESSNLGSSHTHLQKDSVKMEADSAPDSKPIIAESDCREGTTAKDDISLPAGQSPCNKADVYVEDGTTVTKTDSTACAVENAREEKFKFDLMASPSAKSSPERDAGAPGFQTDLKPSTPEADLGPKAEIVSEDTEAEAITKQESGDVCNEANKRELTAEAELQKQMPKERNLDLQLDGDNTLERDAISSISSKQHALKQQQQSKTTKIEPKAERAAQSTSLPLPMTVPGWPGSFPPLGYMGQVPAVQAVVSMDRSTGPSSAMPPPIFPQKPQFKRCATHFYIAKNIYCHQQFTRMNAFWPTAAGSAALYGSKPYNLNAMPPSESTILPNPLQGSLSGRNLGSLQDKGQPAALQGQTSKEKSLPATFMDVAQKKQLVLQQAPQPTPANSIMQAPALFFPMNQPQAAAAATATRSGPGKSPAAVSNANPSSGPPGSVGVPVASVASSVPASMNFNYAASLPANDSQYLAIVPNNGYHFSIPAPVGAPPPYRGNHAQAVPFFSGPFYASQMIHPSQIQQQQHPQSQPQPSIQQANQNTSTSSGSSSSQKQQQQQQILQSCSSNARNGISQSFPTLKQRQQQAQSQNAAHQARLESEAGGEDSPSTSDSRVFHAQKNAYNHNFAIPVHPQNFTLMSPAALAAGSHGGEKQQSQQQHHQGLKGMELSTPQAFAMSFASFNGTAAGPGLDFSTVAHNHPVFHSLPEAARHGYQMVAAAATQSAQKKNHPSAEEGRAASDSVNANASSEDDKKTGGKGSTPMIPHSLVFSRPEGDPSMSTILGNGVIDSSARATLNLVSTPANGNRSTSRPAAVATAPNTSVSATSLASQQQLIQLQKQQPVAARTKPTAANNANVFNDRLPPPTMAKFPNAVSVFPQGLIQGSSPNQSQWKNSTRTGTAAAIQSPTSAMQSMKSLPQQQGRVQVQGLPSSQTQISFGVNPKSTPSGQQHPAPNQPPSAGIGVGSPPASISKGSAGNPMTSAAGKVSPPGTGPSQAAKNSQSATSRKSSPVGGRSTPSIQSNSHVGPAQSSSGKPQQQQNQHQQAQLQKQTFQQAQQLFFHHNPYLPTQSPHPTGNVAAGFYQRREQQQQPSQQNSPGAMSSSAIMSIGSPSLTAPGGAGASDPAKAVAAAAAANNLKNLPPQSLLHAAQFAAQSAGNPHSLVSTFPYIQAMPAAVSMKPPAEQKPVAGNEPEKR